jgi:hypothetical protein
MRQSSLTQDLLTNHVLRACNYIAALGSRIFLAILVIDALEALLKVHAMREARGTALSDETAANIVKELKPKHPILAAVIERGHKMDLKETFAALIVIDALKRLLKIHAARLATD